MINSASGEIVCMCSSVWRAERQRMTEYPCGLRTLSNALADHSWSSITRTSGGLRFCTVFSVVLIATILVAATLESAFAVCLGCIAFNQLMRWGVIPASVCRECSDISGRLGLAR